MKKLLGALVLVLVACLACTAFATETKTEKSVPENAVVNWGDLDYVTTIKGHEIGDYTITKEPTCSEYGIAEFDCMENEAGNHQHVLRIAKLPHTWSSEVDGEDWGKVIDEADCSKTGKAQDICVVCKTLREKYRTIEKQPHSYNNDTYEVYREPTCALHGLGQHKCIWCGALNEEEIDEDGNPIEEMMVWLPLKDHQFSDWTILKKATCDAYGEADRACIVCGMHQRLDDKAESHDIYEWIGDDYIRLLDYVDGVKKPNPLWDEDWIWMNDEELGEDTFNNQAVYQEWLNWAKDYIDYKIVKNWLVDCYTRELTFQCPYCKGEVHEDHIIKLIAPATIAHQWEEKKDEDLSRPATCTEDGYNIYLCKHDADHGHDEIDAPNATYADIVKQGKEFWGWNSVHVLDPQVKIEKVPALGHDWSDWEVVRTYTKDGVKYVLRVRSCQREGCDGTEEEVKELETSDGKTGLVKDDDGEWRYYEGNELVKETKIVGLDNGDFWIVDGVLAGKCMGLTFCPDGKFYYLNQGQIQRVTQLAEYEGQWFGIKNGELDETVDGLVDYDGGKFLFTKGWLRKDINGLCLVNGEWYFFANGQLQEVSQVASYDGEFFVIENGKLDADYNGTITYDGATFNVVNGQLYPIEAAEEVENG